MQVRTERRLGFVAAIALTLAAFTVPPITPQLSSYLAQELSAYTSLSLDNAHSAHRQLKLSGLEILF